MNARSVPPVSALRFERDPLRFGAARLASGLRPGAGSRYGPLELVTDDAPTLPGLDWVRLRPRLAGICGSDLATVDGRSSRWFEPIVSFPFVPGHEVVGRIDALGTDVSELAPGMRVGVPWLGWTCGHCTYCEQGRENLCDRPQFTGYTRDGGFATHLVADARYCFPLGEAGDDTALAPLLCAGLIGWRSLVMAGSGKHIGIYGFGAAGHIVAQVAHWQGRSVHAFTRKGDADAQALARSLGAVWAGASEDTPPAPLDAAIIFAPVGSLVPAALRAVRKGGTVVCGGIHMSDIPAFPYDLLWGERRIVSVANLTRQDGDEFLALAAWVPVRTTVHTYRLEDANAALSDLRSGVLQGAAVLVPD